MSTKHIPQVWERSNSIDLFQDVGDFHRKFDLESYPARRPGFPPFDHIQFRLNFLHEEMTEIEEAVNENDLAKFLDGLVDLVYVALGTAHLCGLPFTEAWMAVHGANMKKERATGSDDIRSKRGHQLDVVKPEGWTPPDIEAVIRAVLQKAGQA